MTTLNVCSLPIKSNPCTCKVNNFLSYNSTKTDSYSEYPGRSNTCIITEATATFSRTHLPATASWNEVRKWRACRDKRRSYRDKWRHVSEQRDRESEHPLE